MQQNDRTNVIIKIQLALNYLKLCADHENPIGGGVPVDIVAMPDFVVDMDGYAVEQLNQGHLIQRLASGEIGSRAGRILSILAHLRDMDDEGFNLHYVAKTGDVGRAVLKKRLNTDLQERHLQPLNFPFLLHSKETRYAILGRKKLEKKERQLVKNKDILTCHDLVYHFYQPLDIISKSAAVYFATDNAKQFMELIESVVLGKETVQTDSKTTDQQNEGEDRHVFIDLSALGKDEDKDRCKEKLKEVITERDERAAYTRLSIMIDSTQSSDLPKFWNESNLCKKGDVLLLYNNREMFITDGNTSYKPVELPYQDRPGGRDAFVAGFLLHRAVATAWKRIPPLESMRHLYSEGGGKPASEKEVNAWKKKNWPQKLFPNPYADTDNTDAWPLSEAVDFGDALATLWRKESNIIPDRWNLLYGNLKTAEHNTTRRLDAFEPGIKKALEFVRISHSKKEPHLFFVGIMLLVKLWIEETIPDNLADKVKEFMLSLLNEDLSIQPSLWKEKGNKRSHTTRIASMATIQTQFVLDALRRMSMEKHWRPVSSARACLFDLDGTLIQSSGLRRTCLQRAFLAMLVADPECEIDENVMTKEAFPKIPKSLLLKSIHNFSVLDVPMFLDCCYELYNQGIYKRWDDWQDILASYPYYAFGDLSKDFRQVWNHALSYAVFILVLQRCIEHERRRRNVYGHGHFFRSLGNSPAAIMIQACSDQLYQSIINRLKNKEIVPTKELLGRNTLELVEQDIAILDQKYRKIFQAAVNNYWDVQYQPLPYIKQFLRTLRDVLSVKLYVATEGHHDTQLAKLRTVGLDVFFQDLCIMSTGAAATPAEHVRNLKDSITEYDGNIGHTNREIAEFEKNRLDRINEIGITHRGIKRKKLADLIANDSTIKIYDDLRENKEEQLKQLEQERSYLKIYRLQWDFYQRKDLEAIYSLMIACIMADSERPFLYLTNLHQLALALKNLPVDHQGLSLTMIGDRESKDIGPLLRALEKAGCPIDIVTTVRLLTWDHRLESLYWHQKLDPQKKPLAKYVAWNSLQALLLLSSMTNWSNDRKLKYREIPPIVNARLFKDCGSIDYNIWDAMAWGFHRKEKAETYTLMNYFIMESTVSANAMNAKGIVGFTEALSSKIRQAREDNQDEEYQFAWVVLSRFLANVIAVGACQIEIANIIRDSICNEILGGKLSHDHCVRIVDSLMTLSGGDDKAPYCLPPIDLELLINNIPFVGDNRGLGRLPNKWRENIPKLAEALQKRMNKVLQSNNQNNEEYQSAWFAVEQFLTDVVALGECKPRTAETIRDIICNVILADGVKDNEEYSKMSINLLEKLYQGDEGAPFCEQPDTSSGLLCKKVIFSERERLSQLLSKWNVKK